ncbi:hypothetical protein GJ496_006839 [Pomphorhynchus laevis]|nr:hypothetical protein GJ496_006839 [Pomphorhynchus laevis]
MCSESTVITISFVYLVEPSTFRGLHHTCSHDSNSKINVQCSIVRLYNIGNSYACMNQYTSEEYSNNTERSKTLSNNTLRSTCSLFDKEQLFQHFTVMNQTYDMAALRMSDITDQYSDYENYDLKWGQFDRYEILKAIGRGKFSNVFEGFDITLLNKVIIKVLKPIKLKKIQREVNILNSLRGGPNIIQLLDIVINPIYNRPSLIFEHINNDQQAYHKLSPLGTQRYIYEILKALCFAHQRGIMHRDIKPDNIVMDVKTKQIRVIDWGLAEYYHYLNEYHVRVASRYYKGPELLTGYKYYDFNLDMWSLGCILAAMTFKKDPFFKGFDNHDQLVQITKVLGTKGLEIYLAKYEIELNQDLYEIMRYKRRKIRFENFVNRHNRPFVSEEVLDLLKRMLVYDHMTRITSEEAIHHPYFNDKTSRKLLLQTVIDGLSYLHLIRNIRMSIEFKLFTENYSND